MAKMHSLATRRTALQLGATLVAGAAVDGGSLLANEKPDPMDVKKHPYIDAHSHVWPVEVAQFPLANGKSKKDLDPPSFTPEQLFGQAQPVGVGRVVLIQHHIYHGWDNSYLIDCAARNPETLVVTGMVDDTLPHPDIKMKELLAQRVRALRITSFIRKEKWLEGPGMNAIWKMAAQTRQVMACLIDAKYLPDVDAMCLKHADTPVVIDHLARIGVDGQIREQDIAALCKLAQHRQTHVKLSAFYALGKKTPPYLDLIPLLRRVLDAFGPERCMWASDSPYQLQGVHSYQASLDLIRDKLEFLAPADKECLLVRTAEKLYFA